MKSIYQTIIVKVSGESLADERDQTILDRSKLSSIASSIKEAHMMGAKIGLVVGAGNIWRGKLANKVGIEQATGDYMGMLGTIINALALQSALEEIGLSTRVMSSINVPSVSEPYIRRKALSHLEKGRIVIFAGGTGNPFFTTDTTASLRALEMKADAIIMGKNGVEGISDSDPRLNDDAKFLAKLTYREVIERNLGIMDMTAVTMLEGKGIIIRVFNMDNFSSLTDVLSGQEVGSIIEDEEM